MISVKLYYWIQNNHDILWRNPGNSCKLYCLPIVLSDFHNFNSFYLVSSPIKSHTPISLKMQHNPCQNNSYQNNFALPGECAIYNFFKDIQNINYYIIWRCTVLLENLSSCLFRYLNIHLNSMVASAQFFKLIILIIISTLHVHIFSINNLFDLKHLFLTKAIWYKWYTNHIISMYII